MQLFDSEACPAPGRMRMGREQENKQAPARYALMSDDGHGNAVIRCIQTYQNLTGVSRGE